MLRQYLCWQSAAARIGVKRGIAIPVQLALQQEVILTRMKQILASRALTDDEHAQLLYERGVLYDSITLRALARNAK